MAVREGVHVIYDISSATRTAQYETRLGSWDELAVYQVNGVKYGVEFRESVLAPAGLVQFVHLDPWRDGDSVEVDESVIDELLANGWSLADG